VSTIDEVIEAVRVTRANERGKAAVIDSMLARLSSQTDARRILEAAQNSNTAESLAARDPHCADDRGDGDSETGDGDPILHAASSVMA
jgi:hypothetical protein